MMASGVMNGKTFSAATLGQTFARSPRPFCPATYLPRRRFDRSQQLVVRAETEEKQKDRSTEKKEKLVADFKKGGLDKATAQRVLSVWEETGATDESGLKKLLLKRSLASALTIAIQTALDAGAAFGAFSLSGFLSQAEGIPAHQLLSIGASFLGSYFAVGVLFDLFSLGVLISSSLQFQTDSAAFLAAVKEIGGSNTGLNVVDKAAQAQRTLKVFQALQSMSDLLKEEAAKGGEVASNSLGTLSTYLLLQQAERQGFDYQKAGLSVDEAGDIARLFARYDTNDDSRLDLSEITFLARELQPDLGEDEVKEAFKLIDTDNSRYIEFPEFVTLYQNKLKPPAVEGSSN